MNGEAGKPFNSAETVLKHRNFDYCAPDLWPVVCGQVSDRIQEFDCISILDFQSKWLNRQLFLIALVLRQFSQLSLVSSGE